jgi:hypothetical protein
VGAHVRLKIHHLPPPLPLKLGANLSEGLSELVVDGINHQFYKSTRIKRRVKMSFTLDLGVLN